MEIIKLVDSKIPSVCVVMGTYNGEKFLEEQIVSILNQVDISLKLVVRDDGSDDGTVKILESFKGKGLLEFKVGHNIGYSENYLKLLQSIMQQDWDYVALSDQDDIWDENKLSIAIKRLLNEGVGMYASRRRILSGGKDRGLIYPRGNISPTFLNSCFENICPGCTIVMSKKFAKLSLSYLQLPEARGISFDSLLYSIAVGQDMLYFDDDSYIAYRLHADNLIGIQAYKGLPTLRSIGNFNQALANKIRFLDASRSVYVSKDHQVQLSLLSQKKHYLARAVRILRMPKFRQRRTESLLLKIFVATLGPFILPKGN